MFSQGGEYSVKNAKGLFSVQINHWILFRQHYSQFTSLNSLHELLFFLTINGNVCRKEAFLTEKYAVFCFVLKEKLKMHK